jgi:hypothetical protein
MITEKRTVFVHNLLALCEAKYVRLCVLFLLDSAGIHKSLLPVRPLLLLHVNT